MAYILALDQGTTSSRAILFDSAGSIRQVAQKEFTQIFPQTGWVEHDPEEIWSTQLGVAVEALWRRPASRPRRVAAIGITNQRETTVVWDRETGEPVYNAIVWQDRRTAAHLRRAAPRAARKRRSRRAPAWCSTPTSRAPSCAGFSTTCPAREQAAEDGELAFGTVDTWLVWNLTGGAVHATDPSNASRTLLFNIHTGEWDDELLQLLRDPARACCPRCGPRADLRRASSHPAFAAPIPIARHRRRPAGGAVRPGLLHARA